MILEQTHSLRRRQRGLTLLEVMISMVVVAVPTGWILQSIATAAAARVRAESRAAAIEGALGIVDQLRATPIDEVVLQWVAGGAIGDTFSLPGLDEDGAPAGRVQLITDETITDDEIGMELGMPRDLDGDGVANNADVSATAQILPAIVEVTWSPAPGSVERFRIPTVVFR